MLLQINVMFVLSAAMVVGQTPASAPNANSTGKGISFQLKGSEIASRRFAAFAGAYQMDEVQKKWLNEELKRRAVQFDARDRERLAIEAAITEAARLKQDNKALLDRLNENTRNDPLNIETLIQLVDQHVRPEQRIGGMRIRERHKHREKEELAANQARMDQQLREQKSIRRSFQAAPPKAPAAPRNDRVIPTGKAAVTKSVAGQPRPNRDNRNRREFDRRENSKDKSEGVVKAARPADWPKIVSDAANRYRFNAAQRATAEGILKDCQRRADAFRTVHERDFRRLTTITDTKVRAQTQKELEAPLAAIEQELRERLEQIPTAEQRAAPVLPRK